MSDAAAAPLGLEAPAGNRRFPRVDMLRAIAALSVLAYHWRGVNPTVGGIVGKLTGHGDVGVSLFFLISGFLLYRPYVTGRTGRAPWPRTRPFYERRLLRIVPAYWVALTILAIYPGVPEFSTRWWQLYVFGQVYDPRTVFGAGIGAAWSLCVEITFYLLLPVYAAAARSLLARHRGARGVALELAVLAALALLSVGFHQWLHEQPKYGNLAFTLPGTVYLFAEGMALAILSVHFEGHRIERALARGRPLVICAAILLYVGVSLTIPASTLGSVNPVWGVIAFLALLPMVVPTGKPRRRSIPQISLGWLGLISYGIYLWHQGILLVLQRHFHGGASLGLTLVLSIIFGAASYYIVERPWLRLKSRLAATPGTIGARSSR
jgi:peptidoglycan/LPS O-acetylase OafA/YrhL